MYRFRHCYVLKNCWAWLFVGCGKKCSITIPVPFLVYNMNHLALKILRGKLGRETITTIISVYCLPITSSILYKYFVVGFPSSFIFQIHLDNTFLICTRLFLFDIKDRKTLLLWYLILIMVNRSVTGFFQYPLLCK